MHKLGRIVLWLIPFTWPLALWRSVRAGQRKRDAALVTAMGGTVPVHAHARGTARIARRLVGPAATDARVRATEAAMCVAFVVVVCAVLQLTGN